MAYQVHLLDQFTQVGEIKEFDIVEVVEQDLAVGSWRLIFDPGDSTALADAALTSQWLGIEVVDTTTGWRFKGNCTRRGRTYAGGRRPRTIELRGVDDMDILAGTTHWPDPLDSEDIWKIVYRPDSLESYVRGEVIFQRGTGAIPNRRAVGLTSPPGVSFGPIKNTSGTRRPLLEVFEPWFKGTPWTMRMRFVRSGISSATAEIQFTTAIRQLTDIQITPDNYDGEIEVIETAAEYTHIVGMGAIDPAGPEADHRFTAEAQSAEDSWLRAHREHFLNRPSGNQTEIDEEVLDLLTASGPQFSINADNIHLPTYGSEVLIGDYVTVAFDNNTSFQSPIAEVRLTGTPDGWTRKAAIGDVTLTPQTLLNSKITTVADQVRRIEGSR